MNVDRSYTSNGLNQYSASGSVSLGYDGRGNLNSSGGTIYTYTSDNHLAVGQGAYLAHDPLGRLFNGNVDPGFNTTLLNDETGLIAEEDQSSGATLRRYVHGAGTDEVLVWYEGSGTSDKRWLVQDERNSVVAVTNASGAATAINSYDDYGIPGSGNQGRFQYTGQKWLPNLGMYDYKARIYSPTLGRFLQTDPIGYGDGPNWYNYVGSDPVNEADPTGLYDPAFCNGHPERVDDPRCVIDVMGTKGGGSWPNPLKSDKDDLDAFDRLFPKYSPTNFDGQQGSGGSDSNPNIYGHGYKLLNAISEGPCKLTDRQRAYLVQHFSTPFEPGAAAVNGRVDLLGLLAPNPIRQQVVNGGLGVINTTLPGHVLHSDQGGGTVVRAVIIGEDGRAYSSTIGTGSNSSAFIAGANQIGGPPIFDYLDWRMASFLKSSGGCR